MSDISREEVDAKLDSLKSYFEARFAALEATMRVGFAEIRAEMQQMRTDLRTEMHRLAVNMFKWSITTMIALQAIFAMVLIYAMQQMITVTVDAAVERAVARHFSRMAPGSPGSPSQAPAPPAGLAPEASRTAPSPAPPASSR
jgi:hypothetical protein